MNVLRAVVLLGLSVVLVGCGDAAVGTWKLDKDKSLDGFVEAIEKEMKDDGPGTEVATSMMKAMLEHATFEIRMQADKTFEGTMKLGPENNSIEGTWEKVSEGYKLTPKEGSHEPALTAKLKGGRLVIEPNGNNGPTIYLKKG